MALKYINGEYDPLREKYVSGFEITGTDLGIVRVDTEPPNVNAVWGMVIEEARVRKISTADITKGTRISVGGENWGAVGVSTGDTIEFVIETPDGSTDTVTYTYTLGDDLAAVVAFLQESADALEADAMTFSIASGKIKGVADVAGATLPTLAATFVDVAPGETTFTLGTWTAAAKASKVLTASANPADGDTVTADGKVYRFKDTLAQANDVLIDPGTAATATLNMTGQPADTQTFTVNDKTYTLLDVIVAQATATLSLTGQPSDTQTFTVNDQTYTLLSILVDAPNNILIGGTTQETCDNILAALTGGGGAGTTYGNGTVAPTDVDASDGTGTTIDFTATSPGVAANSFVTTETMDNATFTNGATMVGGVDDTADTILIGATTQDTADNILAALTGAGGAGTTYGTGTAGPTDVTASNGAGTTIDFTADATGVAANSFATTDTMDNAGFAGATMSGGVDPSASLTLDSLIAANTGGAGSGTLFHADTVAHTTIVFAAGDGDTVLATAVTAGVAGNSLAIAKSSTALSWAGGAVLLTGGADVLGSQTFTVATVTATGTSELDTLDQVVGDPLDPPAS